MEKSHEYEIINHSKNTTLGRVWWDGKKVQGSTPSVLHFLEDLTTGGKSLEDGPEFLERLPTLFRTGYVSAKKVK